MMAIQPTFVYAYVCVSSDFVDCYYLFPVTVRLIVATKLYPTPIVCRLLCFVKPSRPVVVFSPYKEVGVFFGGVWMY